MFTATVDSSKARAKMRAVVAAGPASRRAAVLEMTRLVLIRALATAPRDTNRYFDGWAKAGNSAGIGRFPVLPLNRNSRFDQIESRIRNEIQWWQRIVDRYRRTQPGRDDKWTRQANRRLAAAQREYERLFSREDGAVIGINTFSSLGSKRTPRAIFKVYGGEGRIIDLEGGSATVVQLHNKEPHTSMVERNTHNMARAYSAFRGTGLMRVRGAYLQKALEAVDKAGGGAVSHGTPGGSGLSVI